MNNETILFLVGGWAPLWKIWKSVGMMTFPIWWEKWKPCSNHQPVYIYIFIDIHQTTTQWRPHVLHQGWFLQDETLHGTWPWQGQWHGHLDLSLGHVFWDQNWWNFGEIYHFFHVFFKIQNLSWFFACLSTVWTARPRICSFLKPQLHHFLWPQSPLLGVHLARSCQKGHRGPWLRAFWWHGQDGAFLALNGRSGSQWFITVMAINISYNWISTGI